MVLVDVIGCSSFTWFLKQMSDLFCGLGVEYCSSSCAVDFLARSIPGSCICSSLSSVCATSWSFQCFGIIPKRPKQPSLAACCCSLMSVLSHCLTWTFQQQLLSIWGVFGGWTVLGFCIRKSLQLLRLNYKSIMLFSYAPTLAGQASW